MSDDIDVETGEKQELDLSSGEVVTKYKNAAEIANKILTTLVSSAKAGAKVGELCDKGDKLINELCANVFKNAKKKIEKGVAFPTCVSLNNLVCHVSPAPDSTEDATLAEGDLVKIDLGVHIDGFIAVVAHSLVVGDFSDQSPLSGKAADVIAAANAAAEVALRLVRPGKKNSDVTEALHKVADAYGVKVVEGVLMHQQKQFVIDANKVVLSVTGPEARVEEVTFEENEVYAIDVVMSTGEGKPRVLDEKSTQVYKRAVDKSYSLKLKASRALFSEVASKFSIMPFAARSLETKGAQARLGLVECVGHELLQPYPVLQEKAGDLVAHIKFTVLLMPNGSDRITGGTLQPLQSSIVLEEHPEVKAYLALGTKSKKKGGGKKKKGKKGDDAMETEGHGEAAEAS